MCSSRVDLSVKIGDLSFKNPIILASGSVGGSGNALGNFASQGFAGVVCKTLSKEPDKGNPHPRVLAKLRGQHRDLLINSEGLPNIGVDAFSKQVGFAKNRGAHVIGSIAGSTIEEFIEMACKLERAGVDVIELNAACPHRGLDARDYEMTRFGHYWSSSPKLVVDLAKAVKEEVSIPVWIKFLTIGTSVTTEIAKAVERGGGDAVVICTYLPTLPIDANTGKPMLGNPHGVGNETGPHMKFVSTKLVADVARSVKIPVIATGGCGSGLDVVECLMAGAQAVQALTVFMCEGTEHLKQMLSEMELFMVEKGFTKMDQIIGTTLKYLPPEPVYVF